MPDRRRRLSVRRRRRFQLASGSDPRHARSAIFARRHKGGQWRATLAHGAAVQCRRGGGNPAADRTLPAARSEEHTSELQSLMRISYAVFCLKNKTTKPCKAL